MPKEFESAFDKISSQYYNLTTAEKKVADYVLSAPSDNEQLTITELAQKCGVAEATLSRFCRRLGYKSFNAFKIAIINASARHSPWDNFLDGEITPEDSIEIVSKKLYSADLEAINQTMDVVDLDSICKAVDLIVGAKRVLCMGQGGSMLMAMEAQHLFSLACNKFVAVADSHLQTTAAASMDPDDVVLYFSYSGSTKEMMEIMDLAVRRNARTILVTRFLNAPGAAYADIVLQCGSTQTPLQTGSVAARMAQLYLIDLLFSEYSRRDFDGCREFQRRIADALVDVHL